jgi:alkanesulfonate monooxygenase SsuD/methylene tetrahydromethanopterin reductase-like flavin-dependent oxidoreductase (luciferase family)
LGPKPFNNRAVPIWLGGSAEAVLKRTGRYGDGYICSTSSLPNFANLWERISTYARAQGRDPVQIEKAALNYLAIDEDKSRAVAACAAYFERYYGKAPPNIESHMIVGPAAACSDRIAGMLAQGFGTVILGLIVPDLRQLDVLASKILPELKRWV